MHSLSKHFAPHITAWFSSNEVDFTLASPLNEDQRNYLSDHGIDQIASIKQVHGDVVIDPDEPNEENLPEADAIITNKVGLAIAIRTADCLPAYLYDFSNHAIGLVHAGWQSTQQSIISKTVQRMQDEYGSHPTEIKVIFGPYICRNSFSVGEEFRDYFPDDIEEADGNLYVDLGKVNKKQLLQAGVKENHIEDLGIDTFANADQFSFRRDAEKAGRMLHLMKIDE